MTAAAAHNYDTTGDHTLRDQTSSVQNEQIRALAIGGVFVLAVACIGFVGEAVLPALLIASGLTIGWLVVQLAAVEVTVRQSVMLGVAHLGAAAVLSLG